MFNAQTGSDCCEKLEHELKSVLSQQTGKNPEGDEPIIHKRDGCVRRGYCSDRYGTGQFGVSVCQDNYVVIAGFCLGYQI